MSNNRTIRPTMSFCELAVVTATCPRAVGKITRHYVVTTERRQRRTA